MRFSRYVLAAAGVGLISVSFVLTDVPRALAQSKVVLAEVVNPTSRPVPTTLVGHSIGNPVIVGEAEFSTKQPFQTSVQGNVSPTEGAVVRTLMVPAGKRLVIEHFSCEAAVPPGQKAICHVVTTVGGAEAFHFLAMAEQGTFVGSDQFRATQTMRAYADPETVVKAVGQRNDGTGSAIFDFTISGYLVDMP